MGDELSAVSGSAPLNAGDAPSQPLSHLPTPVLALIAAHLPHDSLLKLQRCSSALHRRRSDESYMAAAWRWARVTVPSFMRLPEWTLPVEHTVLHASTAQYGYSIPVQLWLAALPALRAAVDKERQGRLPQLREWLAQSQPSKPILAKRDEDGRLREVHGEVAQHEAGVERVEVLSDISNKDISALWAKDGIGVEVRCRLVLRACPYLLHLSLWIDPSVLTSPSQEDTFALLPRLRSLVLVRRVFYQRTLDTPSEQALLAVERMLHSLPCLTSLRCTGFYFSVADLLAVACHSTLEELYIDTGTHRSAACPWVGQSFKHLPDAAEEEALLDREALPLAVDVGEREGETESALLDLLDPLRTTALQMSADDEGREQAEAERAALLSMRAALTRTLPTQRSCEVRLALVDSLCMRLRRVVLLHTDTDELTRHSYRKQAALLRHTLRDQLAELNK